MILVATVAATSLVGSLHCLAMCGPLQGLYLDPPGRGPERRGVRLAAPLAHAGGRWLAYVALGALAGTLGAAVDLAGRAASIQRIALLLAGAVLIGWGALTLAGALGVPLPRLHGRTWRRGLVAIRRRRPTVRAALIGVLSAALPCGWLWAFVVVAGGTGSAAGGAAVMTGFWLGTVPAMVGLGTVAAPLVQRIGKRMPVVTAVALVAVGIVALSARVPAIGAGGGPGDPHALPDAPACHAEAR